MSTPYYVYCDGSFYWTGKRRRSAGWAVLGPDLRLLDGDQEPAMRSITQAEHRAIASGLRLAAEALDDRYGGAVLVTDQLPVVQSPKRLLSRLQVPDELVADLDRAQELIHLGRLRLAYATSHRPCRHQHAMARADGMAAGFAVGLVTADSIGEHVDPPSNKACRRQWQRTDDRAPASHRRSA